MLNPHARVGVAQIILYAPAIILAAYLFLRHGRPHMAWTLLLLFSCIRLAGGVVVILLENKPSSVGLTIAAIALLNTGVAPLVVATLGFVRIIISLDFKDKEWLRKAVIATRALFLLGVILLVAGGSLEGQYKNSDDSRIGLKLVKAGYLVILIIFVVLVCFQGFFWSMYRRIRRTSVSTLQATALTTPFIIVRITYAFLSVFQAATTGGLSSKWDALYGSVGLFVGMVLIMEYVAVLVFILVGIRIPRIGKDNGNGKGKGGEGAATDNAAVEHAELGGEKVGVGK